ncbi:MAG: arginine--tRNA ligase [candidate division WOR-3 bacterium]
MGTRAELEKLLSERFGQEAVRLEEPRAEEFGDYTTNLAFRLAKTERRSPDEKAEEIALFLEGHPDVARCEVAKGFVNIWLRDEAFFRAAREAIADPVKYTSSGLGRGKRILYEFVSANPTGPLNVVSARAAAVGDCLVKLARRCGFQPEAEFYANDAGGQIKALGESVAWRLGERAEAPPDGYLGEYLIPVAEELQKRGIPPADYGKEAAMVFLKRNMDTLARFGVRFDRITRESEIRISHYRDELLRLLEGMTIKKEEAVFLPGEQTGGEKDRVLIRRSGEPTYLFWDMAYHLHKNARGYDEMVNLLGPDHQTEAAVLIAGLSLIGIKNIRVKIIQQVHLIRGGQKIKMSKRKGEFYSMEDLMEEVGTDAARFFLLMRSTSQPLEFDLDLAKTLASENPVYYVQYLHARCCSLEDFGRERGIAPDPQKFRLLNEPEERNILRKLLYLPDIIEGACKTEEPHLLSHYLLSLAGLFHGYYQRHRIITDDRELSAARLALAVAVKACIREGLSLMGVSAPERM